MNASERQVNQTTKVISGQLKHDNKKNQEELKITFTVTNVHVPSNKIGQL